MPLPFTGLQAFHWGDGVKVLFLYIVLVIVVIGDDVVDGVDVWRMVLVLVKLAISVL